MANGEIKFVHKVSKGSRYNQIYVPQEFEKDFEVGDIVEIKLKEKKSELYYHNIEKLSAFKERLIKEIFSFLSRYKEIEQTFIFGSYLYDKESYRDIDILLLTKIERNESFDKIVYDNLVEEFGLKFHVISAQKDKLSENLKFSPPMRSMLSHFISNNVFDIPITRIIDKNHILFLMMMPEDLLEIEFEKGRVYYDSLRKLMIIDKFLNKEEEDVIETNNELNRSFGKNFIIKLKKDEYVSKKDIKVMRSFISKKIKEIKKKLENGKAI